MSFEDKTTVVGLKTLLGPEANKNQRTACLLVLEGSHAGKMFQIEGNETIVGRSSEVGITLLDEGISRQHARFVTDEAGQIFLEDLQSTNGTFCNGDRIARRQLTDGDKLQIGTATILKFSYQDSIEEAFQRRQYESVTRDALTGCFNKKYFLERLPTEFSFSKRHNKTLTLCMIDIDFFKRVNDTHGHPAGDYVLSGLAAVLLEQIRNEDILVRFGGEEFALVLREQTALESEKVCERIRQAVEGYPFVFEGVQIPTTISIGIATLDHDNFETWDSLVKAADEALYSAKRGGRNQVSVHRS